MGSHSLLGPLVTAAGMSRHAHVFTLVAVVLCSRAAAAPALAQTDLSGWWARQSQNDNGYANEPVDLIGIPVSADGRAKALSYNIASLSATERQCQMYPPWYIVRARSLQDLPEQDPVTQKLLAWRIVGWGDRGEQMVWMDGRPHPSPNAPHTHGGFSTGTWDGNSLKVVTTHFKMGDMKRHARFSSDRATMTYTLDAARRHPDGDGDSRGPGVSRRAVRPHRDLPAELGRHRFPAHGVRADRGAAARSTRTRRSCRTTSRARIRS